MHKAHGFFRIAEKGRVRHLKKQKSAVQKRNSRTHCNQSVHVGRAVKKTLKSVYKKFFINQHNRKGKNHFHKAHCNMISAVFHKPRGNRPVPHYMPHAKIHQRKQNPGRTEEPFFKHRSFFVFNKCFISLIFFFRSSAALFFDFFSVITSRLNRADNRFGRSRAFNAHGICQKIYGAARYARNFTDSLFNARNAGGAAHPGN